jgi:hypothetical protein
VLRSRRSPPFQDMEVFAAIARAVSGSNEISSAIG